jgi:hypothetical protein
MIFKIEKSSSAVVRNKTPVARWSREYSIRENVTSETIAGIPSGLATSVGSVTTFSMLFVVSRCLTTMDITMARLTARLGRGVTHLTPPMKPKSRLNSQ